MMRITAGKFRGTNLFVPDSAETRPTMDRTRQAVFNILRSAPWAVDADGTPFLHDAAVLDVFSGSGAMGFEALSQGASSCTFFEEQMLAITAIEKNILKMRLSEQAKIIKGDVRKAPINPGDAATIAFFDPPYQQGLLEPAMRHLQDKNWINQSTLLILEMHKQEELKMDLTLFDARIYGTSKIVFARFLLLP